MAVKQTAGRKELGEFAPKFAELNDDVLFGEVWSREDKLSLRDRSLVTVTSLMSQGLIDSAFRYHLESAKKNGITKEEITEILTHNAFYAGWPKAWAAFRMAKEVWNDKNEETEDNTIEKHASSMIFPIGEPNDNFAQYFSGKSFLAPVSKDQVGIFNVTFEPKCRNNWHIHKAKRWRSNFDLRIRTRILSGMGQESYRDAARRCCKYSCECQTLARRCS